MVFLEWVMGGVFRLEGGEVSLHGTFFTTLDEPSDINSHSGLPELFLDKQEGMIGPRVISARGLYVFNERNAL